LVAESNYREAHDELLTVVEKMIRIPFKELTDEAVDVFLDCLNEMLKQLADYKK